MRLVGRRLCDGQGTLGAFSKFWQLFHKPGETVTECAMRVTRLSLSAPDGGGGRAGDAQQDHNQVSLLVWGIKQVTRIF